MQTETIVADLTKHAAVEAQRTISRILDLLGPEQKVTLTILTILMMKRAAYNSTANIVGVEKADEVFNDLEATLVDAMPLRKAA